MMSISITELIGLVLGSSGLTGFIAFLINLSSKKKREAALASQEEEKVHSLDIKNTKDVIDLYKNGMKDLQNLMMTREKELLEKVTKYSKDVDEYKKENKELRELVDRLRSTQLVLKSRLDTLTAQSLQDCNKCSFKDECMKFKAKRIIIDED